MAERAQGRRAYNSPSRRLRAEQTRARILESAAELWVRVGYAGASIDAVAKAAGVVPETVYMRFGTKAGLLKELLDLTLVGDLEPVALLERPWTRTVLAETDQAGRVRALARAMRDLVERLGPVHAVMRAAATSDDGIAELARTHARNRLTGQRTLVGWIADLGPLRNCQSVDDATATYFALTSPELHWLLTRELGWSGARYECWLRDRLLTELVAAAP